METMKKHMEKCSDICEGLLECVHTECLKENGDIVKAGMMTDMIKDLAEAKSEMAEACFHKTIVEAMEEAKKDDPLAPVYGYNPNRYASGRYAPAGHGNMTRGYHPSGHEYGMDMIPWDMMNETGRLGYTEGAAPMHKETPDQMIEHLVKKYQTSSSPEEKRHIKEKVQQAMSRMA